MNMPFGAIADTAERIVYVRPIAVADLPEQIRDQIEGPEQVVYSVHATDGQRLALVADRAMAFHLARAHDCSPVNAH